MSRNKLIALTIPLPLNIANSRMHWRKKNKEKKAYWSALDALYACKQIPKAPRTAWPKAKITVSAYLWSYQDEDNLMARLKWPIDWLRHAGYIEDDKKRNLTYTGLPDQAIDRKNQRLEIILERL